MKKYIGVKEVKAMPMDKAEYCYYRGWKVPADEDRTEKGYLVEYLDSPNLNHDKHKNYISWSPADVFDRSYKLMGNLHSILQDRGFGVVFPSNQESVAVTPDEDYGGAHLYFFDNSTGFSDGKAQYVDSHQCIQFVQKNLDGSMIPGLQSEQLVLALLDRAVKLNNRFPSDQNLKMIEGLEMFLAACKERIEDRMSRGVMGDLKK